MYFLVAWVTVSHIHAAATVLVKEKLREAVASVWRKINHDNEQCFTVISLIVHTSALYGIPGDSLECLLTAE